MGVCVMAPAMEGCPVQVGSRLVPCAGRIASPLHPGTRTSELENNS